MASLSLGKKLRLFFKESFAPGLHIAYFSLVFLSFQGAVLLLMGTEWTFGVPVLLGIAYLFSINFLIRAADEIKDYDYDRSFNPSRPLVQGSITHRDLWIWMAASTVLCLALSYPMGNAVMAFALFHAIYSLLLIFVEMRFPKLGDRLFLLMLFTFPVNIMMNIYTFLASASTQSGLIVRNDQLVLLLAIFAASFLHYEFGRKTTHPQHRQAGQRTYSSIVGTWGAVGLSLITMGFACIASIVLILPLQKGPMPYLVWLFLLPPLPYLLKLPAFIKLGREPGEVRKPAYLTGPSMQAMALYLIVMLLNALLALPLRLP